MRIWRWISALLASLAIAFAATTDDPLLGPIARVPPLEPAAALRAFEVQPGFRIELVASEPLIRSPVAIDFDENGRLFVAEYPEYNQHTNPNFKERGCIKLLEDVDGDGRFEKSTVYADQLQAPVAVACWDGGVLAGVVPDLWYFKDSNSDGRADVRTQVLTGFDRDKAGETMLNSFRWGLDNRFTISTGQSGGLLRRADRQNSPTVSIRNQNLRLDPRSGDFTTTSGGGQHGLTFDDWGDTFTCESSHPVQYVAYDSRYLARNPYVDAPSPIVDINSAGRRPNLRRISPPEPWRAVRTRLRVDKQFDGPDEGGQPFGFFTGASGVTVYRGDAWPAEYRGQVFVGEVANNLVYRARLEPTALGWSAVRTDSKREFLASRDIWFRPVQFANAPDGTLYVVDMYRELIETVESMPPSLLQSVDVAGGIHRGRIYRIVPDGFRQPPPVKLGALSTADLVGLLAHRNGWRRDTASRLLYARQDPAAVTPLRDLAKRASWSVARLHALWALAGLSALSASDLLPLMGDPEPRLREHAVRLAEQFASDAAMSARLLAMTDDTAPRVRYQLAFSLAALGRGATEGLAKLAIRDHQDPAMRFAILCSAAECGGELFARLCRDLRFLNTPTGSTLIASLAVQIMAANRDADVKLLGQTLDEISSSAESLARQIVLAVLRRSNSSTLPGKTAEALAKQIVGDALNTAVDEMRPVADRVDSIRLLGHAPLADVREVVRSGLAAQQPDSIQVAVLEVLTRFREPEAANLVIDAWSGMSPTIRATAMETLFARTEWLHRFLGAVETGQIRTGDVDPARVKFLLNSRDAEVRTRASRLFGRAALSSRKVVIDQYRPAIDRRGDIAKGKTLFQKTCSNCHRLDNHGVAAGPDLSTIRNHSPEKTLMNILDPNRELLPKYFTYQLNTKKGVSITGLITSETVNSISILRADSTSVVVPRADIEELFSTGVSAMPEGLETQIDLAGMADLLAYLLNRP